MLPCKTIWKGRTSDSWYPSKKTLPTRFPKDTVFFVYWIINHFSRSTELIFWPISFWGEWTLNSWSLIPKPLSYLFSWNSISIGCWLTNRILRKMDLGFVVSALKNPLGAVFQANFVFLTSTNKQIDTQTDGQTFFLLDPPYSRENLKKVDLAFVRLVGWRMAVHYTIVLVHLTSTTIRNKSARIKALEWSALLI